VFLTPSRKKLDVNVVQSNYHIELTPRSASPKHMGISLQHIYGGSFQRSGELRQSRDPRNPQRDRTNSTSGRECEAQVQRYFSAPSLLSTGLDLSNSGHHQRGRLPITRRTGCTTADYGEIHVQPTHYTLRQQHFSTNCTNQESLSANTRRRTQPRGDAYSA